MNVDVQILAWLALIASGISNALTVWNFVQSPSRKNAEALKAVTESLRTLIEKVGARQEITDKEVSLLKASIEHLPDKEVVHRLEMKVGDIAGDMKAMSEAVKAVREISVMTRDMVAKDIA